MSREGPVFARIKGFRKCSADYYASNNGQRKPIHANFIQKKDTFILVRTILVILQKLPGGILARIAIAFFVKTHEEMCQLSRIAMNR